MKKLLLGLAGACLVSCSTYDSIKEREPAVEVHSTKSVDDYIGCIAPKFIQLWPDSTTVQDGNARVVTGRVQGTMAATVTVIGSDGGSRAEYRQLNNLKINNFKKARTAVTDCQ